MPPSNSKNTPQFVTLHLMALGSLIERLQKQKQKQVACDKTAQEEKPKPRVLSVTELALLILGIGCGLTLSATGVIFYARGQLSLGLSASKMFSGFGSTLPMSDFLFGESQPESIFINEPTDLHIQETLPVALASPSSSITTVVRHGLSGSKPTRKKGLLSWGAAYEQAAPPEQLSKPSDIVLPVTTISPSIASERSAVYGLAALAPPPAVAAVEELKTLFGKGQPLLGFSFGNLTDWYLFRQAFMILIVLVAFTGLSLGLSSVVSKGKGSKSGPSSEPEDALVKLPATPGVPTDNDIMEAFDAFDRNRMGFIDRATVNHMLGHMALPGHLDAAAPFLGSVKKLFYDDFRRLARQPGPFADIIMERVNRREKRILSDGKRAAVFDERCKFGADVDAMEAAISAIGQHSLSPQAASSALGSTPSSSALGGRRSWDQMRADLAPKS